MIGQLRERFGAGVAITDPVDIEPWLTDWRGRWTGQAEAILQPSSTEEVAAIVALAAKLGVALVP
ncbi:MAG: hydroxyacid dehydrogenase, partial [Sphingomicrobium sp.]